MFRRGSGFVKTLTDCDEFPIERVRFALGALASDGKIEEMKAVGMICGGVHEHSHRPSHVRQHLIETLVHSGIKGMAGTGQHGIQMLVPIDIVLAKGNLSVARLGLSYLPYCLQAV
jgi:hypothetical protein